MQCKFQRRRTPELGCTLVGWVILAFYGTQAAPMCRNANATYAKENKSTSKAHMNDRRNLNTTRERFLCVQHAAAVPTQLHRQIIKCLRSMPISIEHLCGLRNFCFSTLRLAAIKYFRSASPSATKRSHKANKSRSELWNSKDSPWRSVAGKHHAQSAP